MISHSLSLTHTHTFPFPPPSPSSPSSLSTLLLSLPLHSPSLSSFLPFSLFHMNPCIHSTYMCRPNWVTHKRSKYSVSDYLLIGWQDNDLPIFGKVQFIAVVIGKPLFAICSYRTIGIDRHSHSFVLSRGTEAYLMYWLSELPLCQLFKAHQLTNGCCYITFRSHIEKL